MRSRRRKKKALMVYGRGGEGKRKGLRRGGERREGRRGKERRWKGDGEKREERKGEEE